MYGWSLLQTLQAEMIKKRSSAGGLPRPILGTIILCNASWGLYGIGIDAPVVYLSSFLGKKGSSILLSQSVFLLLVLFYSSVSHSALISSARNQALLCRPATLEQLRCIDTSDAVYIPHVSLSLSVVPLI